MHAFCGSALSYLASDVLDHVSTRQTHPRGKPQGVGLPGLVLLAWENMLRDGSVLSMLPMCAGRPAVALNGSKVGGWAFDTNNVLSWEHQAGYSAWLQFTHLPGGPLFMGTISPSSADGYVSAADFQVCARAPPLCMLPHAPCNSASLPCCHL